MSNCEYLKYLNTTYLVWRLSAGLKLLRRSSEATVIVMRLMGFVGISMLIGVLSFLDKLSFDGSIPLLVFIPYIVLTTIPSTISRDFRTQNALFGFLFFDILVISSVLFITQTMGTLPSTMNSLYLIVLISASLLKKRYILILGAETLIAYIWTTIATSAKIEFFSAEHITQIAMFILFTTLAASQGYYFNYIVRKRDEEALRMKDQFVFTTAHDLRAPFALIRLLAEKYEQRQPKTIDELREDMEAINANVSAASHLLEDLLRLAKGENVPLKITTIEITPMINSLLEHWQSAIEKKDIRPTYDERGGQTVLGDIEKLEYVFDNLISNGIKYNNRGGSLHVRHEVRGNMLLTMFEDAGYGIAPENIEKVFTPYFRELRNDAIPGTGLGLYSAKKFIEQMNGTIEVAAINGGMRFTIALPRVATRPIPVVSGTGEKVKVAAR